MVTGHTNSPLLILSVMSPFQTVLFKIVFGIFNYHDKINDIFNLTVCLNDCHKKSTDTRKLQSNVNLLSFGAFFHQCSFDSFATTIFARNLEIHSS